MSSEVVSVIFPDEAGTGTVVAKTLYVFGVQFPEEWMMLLCVLVIGIGIVASYYFLGFIAGVDIYIAHIRRERMRRKATIEVAKFLATLHLKGGIAGAHSPLTGYQPSGEMRGGR